MSDLRAPERRVVVLAPAVPQALAPDAGTRYVTLLVDVLAEHATIDVLVPGFTGNRAAAEASTGPARVQVVGLGRGDGVVRRIHLALIRVDQSLPYLPFALGLLRRDVRRMVAAADVVDLQCAEMARLAGLVRRLNPRARIVATHQDVLPQRYARIADGASGLRSRLRWRVAARLARRAQGRAVRRADATVTFSEKDRALLPGSQVVDPPTVLPVDGALALVDRSPVVVFVGYLSRPENNDAARWLLAEIWPSVTRALPHAQLRLVGAGAGAQLTRAAAADRTVTLTGFVEDLGAEYLAARACVVPLRDGAGVKFKVLEALAAGTPLVLTTLGAEGVGGPERFVRLSDDAAELAAGLVEALARPDQAHTDAQQRWARERFGPAKFAAAVARVYGLGDPA